MSSAAKLRAEALALPEDERLALATELFESVDGAPDPEWERAWIAECDRRVAAAAERGTPAPEWTEVHARLTARFAR